MELIKFPTTSIDESTDYALCKQTVCEMWLVPTAVQHIQEIVPSENLHGSGRG